MSQSDYIQRKKISKELTTTNQSKFPHVLDSESYTLYKQYSVENSVVNTSRRFNQIIPSGAKMVFGMEINRTGTCPNFVLCNTQNRVNHTNIHPIALNPNVSTNLPYVKHVPIRTCSAVCNHKKKKTNENTWSTAYSNSRLNKLLCDCSMN
jgi:hypothetical protein